MRQNELRGWEIGLLVIGHTALILFAVLAACGVTLGAEPVPQFTVTNKMPAFTVVNRMTAPKADPGQPAPVGYEWQRWPGRDWELVKVAKEVKPSATPFAASGTTPTTPATGAGVPSSSSSGTYRPGVTFTLAPAGIPGNTNCGPLG